MGQEQFFQCQRRMQDTRIPYLKPVREKLYLYTRVTSIIAMRYCIHYAFRHNFFGIVLKYDT